MTYVRDLCDMKLCERGAEAYAADHATKYVQSCYSEAASLADEDGRIYGKVVRAPKGVGGAKAEPRSTPCRKTCAPPALETKASTAWSEVLTRWTIMPRAEAAMRSSAARLISTEEGRREVGSRGPPLELAASCCKCENR